MICCDCCNRSISRWRWLTTRRIVFVNEALTKWLGVAAADLIGRTCHYRSGDLDPLAAVADGLCPPPETFEGQRTTATIVKPSAVGPMEGRQAEFIPLRGSGDAALAVFVLVGGENLPEDSLVGESDIMGSDESQQLHEVLQRFRQELAYWHHPSRLVGQSPAMIRVRNQVKLAAAGNGAVLIVGPTGIGRQQVARTIHAASSSSTGPFIPIDCANLPPDLFRTTLDSLTARRSPAEIAAAASVALLDVDSLPAESQQDLCKWITNLKRGLRIFSTSRQPLDRLAEDGRFKADLACLLGTLVIELPSLESRREDIPLLAQMFLEDLNAQGSKQLRGFASDAMDRLVDYQWPGQIDELSATVREAAAAADSVEITTANLPKRLHHAAEAAKFPRRPPEPIDLEQWLACMERELIERALREAKQNKAQAARLLGLTRPRLYRRMIQFGLERDDAEVESQES